MWHNLWIGLGQILFVSFYVIQNNVHILLTPNDNVLGAGETIEKTVFWNIQWKKKKKSDLNQINQIFLIFIKKSVSFSNPAYNMKENILIYSNILIT